METLKHFIPLESLDAYLPLYQELYKKYFDEHNIKKSLTEGGKRLTDGLPINNTLHFEYFLIEDRWKEMKSSLDRPIIQLAKYKVGDKIKFIKETWTPKGTDMQNQQAETIKNVECIGIIKNIETVHTGTGEIIYDIDELTPECWECNPYALEKNVLELLASK